MSNDVVFRIERTRNYKTIPLHAISNDSRLSWKAVGLHTYLITRPEGWKYNKQDLISRHTEGKDAIRSGLNELRDCGYLDIQRMTDDLGRVTHWEWTVYEVPKGSASPEAGFPEVDKPHVDNPPYSNNRIVVSNEVSNRDSTRKPSDERGEDVKEVFLHWRDSYERVTNRGPTGPRMVLSGLRRSKIKARLDEGYSVSMLCLAVDGCHGNEYNVGNGYLDIELVCRNQQKVEQYLALAGASEAEKKKQVSMSAPPLKEFTG